MLKFLQSLALEFPHFCRQVFPGNFGWQGKMFFTEKCIENFEKVVLAQVTPPKFLSRNLRSEDLVYNSYIQSNPAISKSQGKWKKVRNSGVSK